MPSVVELAIVRVAPGPDEIFERAVAEGQRRLDQSTLELVATSFIAGFTIVFGIGALAAVEAVLGGRSHGIAHVGGALAFGVGVVFLVVGRSDLFNENFFDPVATAVDREDSWMIGPLARLWPIAIAGNLVGGLGLVTVTHVARAFDARESRNTGES